MFWVLLQYVTVHGVCKDPSQTDSLYTFTAAPVPRIVVWGTPGHPRVHPAVHVCCETWLLSALLPGWLQDNVEAVPYLSTQKCFTSLQNNLLSPTSLFSDSLTPSYIWAFCLPWKLIHQSKITTAIQIFPS